MPPVSPRLLLIALTAVGSMSLVPVLIRSISANAATIGLVRIAIFLLVLTPLLLWRGQLRGLSRADWRGLASVGVVFGLHWWAYFLAIKSAGAALGAIAMSTYGIHLLLLNAWRYRMPLRMADLLAVSLCLLGCYLVAPVGQVSADQLTGFWLGVLAGFLYALLPLLHQQHTHLGTLPRTWGQFAFAGLVFVALSGEADFNLPITDWWLLLVLGLVCTLLSHSLWVKASTELPAVFTSTIYYLYAPIAMLLSALLLGETIGITMMAGALLIIGTNVTLLWWRARAQRRSA